MQKGRSVIIHYDILEPEYDGTDARILESKTDMNTNMFLVERFDGTKCWYSEHLLKSYIDLYEELEEDIPDLPLCQCELRLLMMKGCQCGGL